MKVFIFDAERCNGCYACQIACKDEHAGNDWMPYAKPQPNTGHFWMRVKEKDHGQVPKVFVEYTPWLCMHCDEPACMKAAPEAVYKREDGLVIIDPEKAKGNKKLAEACPYHAIYWNEKLDIAQKCTGCAHLVDEGKIPHCVDLCATGGLRFGDEEEFADEIANAEVMLPESGCSPRVYYLNQPKLFLAGEVWTPETNDIIEGATVSLTAADGRIMTTTTDDFGDFWFRKLSSGVYSLKIEAPGFESIQKTGIELTESLNMGDFPLNKC